MFGQVATKWIFKNIFKYFYWLKDFAIQIPNTLILQILTLNFHVFGDSLKRLREKSVAYSIRIQISKCTKI